MRGIFGLVALLVGVGVLVWVWSSYNVPVARQGQQAQKQAEQLAGYDPQGGRVKDTIKLEPQTNANGKLAGIVVTSLTPGSLMEQHYGLKVGDLITQVGPLPIDDAEMGIARVQEAAQRQESILIVRNGQKLTMPEDAHAQPATPDATANPNPTPAAPSAPPARPGPMGAADALKKQMESTPVPTH